MKQVLIKRGHVAVENVPAPLLEDDAVLVEVAYSLISTGTEVAAVRGEGESTAQWALRQTARVGNLIEHLRRHGVQRTLDTIHSRQYAGSPTGYSCAGTAVQVGQKVRGLRAGDQVACAGAGKATHAELVLAPRNLVVPVPEGCGLRDAASVALGAIVMQGVRRADVRLGEIVAVIGLGLVGQITVQLLKIAGCRVIGFDLVSRRVELAKTLGMSHGFVSTDVDVQNEVRHLTEGHGVDCTIITAASQSNAIVQQAMEITRRKGRVVVVGAVGLNLQRSPFYEKELDLLISTSYGPGRYDNHYEEQGIDYPYAYVRWTEGRNMAEYLRLLAEGKVNVRALVDRVYDVGEAPQAYAELQQNADRPLGVVLRYLDEARPVAVKQQSKIDLRPYKPSGVIGVALVGAGRFAKGTHLPNLRALSEWYHLRAIVSGVGSHAWLTAQQFGADYCTTDYEETLADKSVDMVLICTRHHLHAPMAMAAARAGKAIFLEKPMALSEAELEQLVAVVQETGVPFTVGFNRRFSPVAARLKELLAGRQNPLLAIYRVNAGSLPPDHWVYSDQGGGRVIGEACHMFDFLNYLVKAPVEAVEAQGTAPRAMPISGQDNFLATVRYRDGSLCTLLYTALGATELNKEYLEIHSDGKTMVVRDFETLETWGVRGKGWAGKAADKGHRQELVEFARCLRGERGWPIPLEQLVSTARLSLLANEAVG